MNDWFAKIFILVFSYFFSELVFTHLAWAEEAFIKSTKVDIKESPNPGAKNVTSLNSGQKVSIIEKKGFWYFIQHDQLKGWIPKLMLTENILKKESSLFETTQMSQQARKRASTLSAAGAARGLKESNTDFMFKLKQANYQDFKKLIDFHIDPQKVEKYIY